MHKIPIEKRERLRLFNSDICVLILCTCKKKYKNIFHPQGDKIYKYARSIHIYNNTHNNV